MAESVTSAPHETPDQQRAGAPRWPRLTKGREGGPVNSPCSKSTHAQKRSAIGKGSFRSPCTESQVTLIDSLAISHPWSSGPTT